MKKEPQRDLTGLLSQRAQLIADGYTDNQITRAVRSGKLHRVRYGSYVDGEVWRELTDEDRHRLLSRAVLEGAHECTVLTHLSSAIEHRVSVWDLDLGVVHTTRTDARSGRRIADWAQHRGSISKAHVVVVNGVKVSSPTRAAIEVTTFADVEHALVVVCGFLNAGLTTKKKLRKMAKKVRYWPRSLTTDLVIRLADGRLCSVGEIRTWYMLWKQGLRLPTPQVPVHDEGGELLGIVDFLFEEEGVFLEFDGQAKYFLHRRDGETLEEFIRREKRREEAICAATGWVCVRITWADLARPEQTVARIRRLLASRQGARAS